MLGAPRFYRYGFLCFTSIAHKWATIAGLPTGDANHAIRTLLRVRYRAGEF